MCDLRARGGSCDPRGPGCAHLSRRVLVMLRLLCDMLASRDGELQLQYTPLHRR